jgi:hypothetical protein
MVRDDYAYLLDFVRDDGTAAGQVAVTPDWLPAQEWVYFEAVRSGRLPPVTAAPPAVVEPLWHATAGQPYLSGVRIGIRSGDAALSREFPTSYFRGLATQGSAQLVESGALKSGEPFRYLVSAFPRVTGVPVDVASGDFAVEDIVQPLPLDEASLESYLRGATAVDGFEAGVDVPVFVPQEILDEALALAAAAGDVETGGVLVGRLHRDRAVPEVFVEVTAQIAAPHTEASATKLTFTAETWAAVRAALALRRGNDLMIGWWHHHPDFCRLRGCPIERRRVCTASSAFFSAEDVQLHRAIFARAFHIALLISDSAATGLTSALYGWRRGIVVGRGFHVLRTAKRDHR